MYSDALDAESSDQSPVLITQRFKSRDHRIRYDENERLKKIACRLLLLAGSKAVAA